MNALPRLLAVAAATVMSISGACSSDEPAAGPPDADAAPADAAPTDAAPTDADAQGGPDASPADGADAPDALPSADADAAAAGDALLLDAPGEVDADEPPTGDADAGPDVPAGPHTCGAVGALAGPAISGLVVAENPANVLSFFVDYETDAPALTEVRVDCGPEYRPTLLGDTPRTTHRAFVMGLWDGAACDVHVCARGLDGGLTAATQTFVAGPLPDSLPPLVPDVAEPGQMAPGWTMFNLSTQPIGIPPQIVFIDAQSRYRWYHKREASWAGADIDSHLLQDGVLIGGNVGNPRPARVDFRGDVLWWGNFDMHHEIQPFSADETHVLHLALTADADCPEGLKSDLLVERDTAIQQVVWTWSLCDHFVPDPYFEDWSHTNTVARFQGDSALLVSLRNQNSLVKLDRATEEVVWVLGWRGRPDDGWRGDFAMAEEDRFLQQHAPKLLEDGHVLMFDNGMKGRREYSRALEIAFDDEAMTAEAVWQYRHEPDIFAATWSDADRLENGNTLVAFGVRSYTELAHLVEVTPTGEVVWDLPLPVKWSVYRAARIAEISGQVLPVP